MGGNSLHQKQYPILLRELSDYACVGCHDLHSKTERNSTLVCYGERLGFAVIVVAPHARCDHPLNGYTLASSKNVSRNSQDFLD